MEDRENSGGTSEGPYNKLIHQDLSGDEDSLSSDQKQQQVSMSMVRPVSCLNHYKLLTVSLAVLAVILLTIDIGLGVYYHKLTDVQVTLKDISSEVSKLQASYNRAIQSRNEAKKQLANELKEQQLTKWEMDHQRKRSEDYEKLSDGIQMEIAALKAHIPMIKDGCRHCLPGWTFMNSQCYYFAFSDAISQRSWEDARQFCKRYGGDLAVINNRETHLAISNLVNSYNSGRPTPESGLWIGLRDVEVEGTWKWVDGTRLTEGYWNYGEPNNQGDEDCAATYPRSNPFKAWNDAPCSYALKWICQMTPRLM